jgi:hypothetical protein
VLHAAPCVIPFTCTISQPGAIRLRRYLRLKRNNFVKNHAEFLTDEFLIDSFLPKFENIIEENQELLNKILQLLRKSV